MGLKASRFIVFFLIIFGMVFQNAEAKCERNSTFQIKTYEIDLDKHASERYNQIVLDFKNNIIELVDAYKKKINPKYIPLFEFIGENLDTYFPYPFNEEIKGISRELEINTGDLTLLNIIYDLTAFCTSIVTQDKYGHILHGRNLDYDFPELLQNLTYIAKFKRNGTLLFTSAQLAGYLGILTGHKYKAFTFSINERKRGDWWVNLLFGLLDKKAQPIAFLTRNLMENVTNFNDAFELLRTTDLIAPAYFTIGGLEPYEGVIITRNQSEAIDVWKLNATSSGIEKWYLLETNDDHWLPPHDERREAGMKAMNDTTQANINFDTLLDVLSTQLVCNKKTVYSVSMSARNNDNEGFKIIIH